MTAPRPRILVIRGGAIGDFILTLPALTALRRQFPQAHLEVLGYPHIVQLAQAGGLVDRVTAIESRGLAGFFARGGELSPGLADYFSGFDLILSYLFDPDDIFRTNLARCSQAQFIVGPHRPDENGKIHAAQVYLKPLERLAIFDADFVPRLALVTSLQQGRAGLPAGQDARQRVPTLALHPGSGSERKNWPEAQWIELIARLVGETKFDLLLVGGEAEGGRVQRLAAALPSGRCTLALSLPLVELAQRLKSCTAFVGHDSGITHLAAALGLPCLVLWADTIEEVWRPQGENLVILREAGGIRTIRVERVLMELDPILRAARRVAS